MEERWGDGKRGRRERGREREGRREDRRRRSKRERESGTIEGGERKWNMREKGKWENEGGEDSLPKISTHLQSNANSVALSGAPHRMSQSSFTHSCGAR